MEKIQLVQLPTKNEDNVSSCHKKKRMLRGKRKDILRLQNFTLKLKRKVINARRPNWTIEQVNNNLKRRTKVLNPKNV
jgi:hypothetical protein